MASILRSIVAGPRSRHPEAGLDLCYVTDNIIATSGPSQTYPQRAYRNPLDQLVAFLDAKHGKDWAIWEFRAEGTGYPDDLVYGRVRHYPFPDHHPPPFRLMPMIIASMKNWLNGGELGGGLVTDSTPPGSASAPNDEGEKEKKQLPAKRVVVVHCKAGKGRSGTASCSYLIAEEGWTPDEALARFTERRMRPNFGGGVTIPSQLRWISYVDRWTRGGKRYLDRPIEVVEVHVWGLRNGVKVDVEGFEDEGKKITAFHTFQKHERMVIRGGAPEAGGVSDMVWDMAGGVSALGGKKKAPPEADHAEGTNLEKGKSGHEEAGSGVHKSDSLLKRKGTSIIRKVSQRRTHHDADDGTKTHTITQPSKQLSTSSSDSRLEVPGGPEPGGMAVILKPEHPIRVPTSDINISVELRNRAHKSIGLTMVSAVAHVWFNAFFEGNGPEQDGRPDDSGVFSIDWDAMDGIKGSSRKGARALDRVSVVWRAVESIDSDGGRQHVVVVEPQEGQPVPQMKPADWQGGNAEASEADLGLRTQSPTSAGVSKASSVRSVDGVVQKGVVDSVVGTGGKSDGDDDGAGLEGVKSSGPEGEELEDEEGGEKKDGVVAD